MALFPVQFLTFFGTITRYSAARAPTAARLPTPHIRTHHFHVAAGRTRVRSEAMEDFMGKKVEE